MGRRLNSLCGGMFYHFVCLWSGKSQGGICILHFHVSGLHEEVLGSVSGVRSHFKFARTNKANCQKFEVTIGSD